MTPTEFFAQAPPQRVADSAMLPAAPHDTAPGFYLMPGPSHAALGTPRDTMCPPATAIDAVLTRMGVDDNELIGLDEDADEDVHEADTDQPHLEQVGAQSSYATSSNAGSVSLPYLGRPRPELTIVRNVDR